MTERLIVSPGDRAVHPAAGLLPRRAPTLGRTTPPARPTEPIDPGRRPRRLGGRGRDPLALRRHAEGVIVLAGERVVTGQPVAWLRVEVEPNERSVLPHGSAPRRSGRE